MILRISALLIPALVLFHSASGQFYKPSFEKITLDNGMRVILHRDTTFRSVAINMSYHAGSSRDPKGKSGLANLSGGLLLAGTKKYPQSELVRLRRTKDFNIAGLTNVDWTTIYSVVLSDHLDTALAIEADRLKNTDDGITDAIVKASIQSILERRRASQSQPLSDLNEGIYRELYPTGHPYQHVTIGDTTDLLSVTVDDVKKFMRIFFVPANATLCIGGNFEPSRVKSLIRKYFNTIPGGRSFPWREEHKTRIPIGDEVKLISEDLVSYSTLELIFPSVPIGHPDEPAMQMLAQLLAGSDEARLIRNIAPFNQGVYRITASQQSHELSGVFRMTLICAPETNLRTLYDQVTRIINTVGADVISEEEMRMSRNLSEMQFLTPLELLHGTGGRCDVLNLGELYRGNPALFFERQSSVSKVTAVTVKSVAQKYLTNDRIVVSVVPAGKRHLAVTD